MKFGVSTYRRSRSRNKTSFIRSWPFGRNFFRFSSLRDRNIHHVLFDSKTSKYQPRGILVYDSSIFPCFSLHHIETRWTIWITHDTSARIILREGGDWQRIASLPMAHIKNKFADHIIMHSNSPRHMGDGTGDWDIEFYFSVDDRFWIASNNTKSEKRKGGCQGSDILSHMISLPIGC